MMRALFSLVSPAGRRGRLATLILHRVAAAPDPLFPEEIDARRFDLLCGWWAQWFNVLPLDEAVQRLREGRLPARALAISFDDGYEDNLAVAQPILQRHRLPATLFVASGFLDGGCMWNDIVVEALRGSGGDTLDLRGVPHAELGVVATSTPAQRRAAIDAILPAVKYLPPAQRLEAVHAIAARARVPLRRDLMLRSDQVRALHRAGMRIGAHTVEHPILATLAPEAALAEMTDSKRALEAITGAPVRLFAYPNGKPVRDYGADAVAAARAAGFDAAFTTAQGAASGTSDVFQLPRIAPWARKRLRYGLQAVRQIVTAATVVPSTPS